MREVKFRGINNTFWDEEWFYGFLHENDGLCIDGVPVREETVGQFTGLKDKNGQGIYEGDVVRKRDILGVVIWANEYQSLGFYLKSNENLYNVIAPYYSWDLEIIGNIYEHPELLSEETN